jgi:hypothetical protein
MICACGHDEIAHPCGRCVVCTGCESFRSSIPLILYCPECHKRHIDEGEWAARIHHTHSCQHCGMTWRPAVLPTVGVQFLPGFKKPMSDEKVIDDKFDGVPIRAQVQRVAPNKYIVLIHEYFDGRTISLADCQDAESAALLVDALNLYGLHLRGVR